ncbi:MAG TPA: MarR family transcriptional regulator, partial [Hyphomicrobiaceae bacterium]|nr:MarR family transcriptional regulator [Hyphomicrobiaceae bacterium]
MARPTQPRANPKDVLSWVERVATFFAEHYGLPPITGRILGWLMICNPPEQSPAQIAAAIGASRASLTTNIRLLIASGLVHRLTRAGGRTTYYRIDDDTWEKVIRRRIASMMSFGALTQDAI